MGKLFNLLTVSVLFFFGCSHLQSQSQKVDKATVQSENQIGYLFFKVIKDQSGVEKISLTEKKIVQGKMKSIPVFVESEMKSGDFLITLCDKKGREIMKQHVEDPLNPELEVFGDEMARHRLKLNETEFSIRFPYSPEIESVKIEKITNSKKKLLFTQNL